MIKIKKFNELKYEYLIDSINNSQNTNLELISEGFDFNKYQRITKKLIKKIGVDSYYISTNILSVSSIYPIVQNLIKDGNSLIDLTDENIILLTMCAITALSQENKEKVTKLFSFAVERGIPEEELDKIISQIKIIQKIFTKISKNFGKVIITLSDMLSYTELLIPFMSVFNTLMTQKLISSDLLFSIDDNFSTLESKLLLHRIMHKLEIIIKGTDKFRNQKNVKPLLVNDELKNQNLVPYKFKVQ